MENMELKEVEFNALTAIERVKRYMDNGALDVLVYKLFMFDE